MKRNLSQKKNLIFSEYCTERKTDKRYRKHGRQNDKMYHMSNQSYKSKEKLKPGFGGEMMLKEIKAVNFMGLMKGKIYV